MWIPKWEAEYRGFHKLKEEPLRLDLTETEWCAMFSAGGAIGPDPSHLVVSILFFVSVECHHRCHWGAARRLISRPSLQLEPLLGQRRRGHSSQLAYSPLGTMCLAPRFILQLILKLACAWESLETFV